MAFTVLSRYGRRFFLTVIFTVIATIAIAKTTDECISQLESGGNYNSPPSPLGHQGKYQMGVAALMDAKFCKKPAPGPTQDSNQNQIWKNCIVTDFAKNMYGIQANPDGSIKLSSFRGNGAAQETAYQMYRGVQRTEANNRGIYGKYVGKTINGIKITDGVIDYLMWHGGVGGAEDFLSSNGQHCREDKSVGSSLCKSAVKMSDCLNGTTTGGGGGGGQPGNGGAVWCVN